MILGISLEVVSREIGTGLSSVVYGGHSISRARGIHGKVVAESQMIVVARSAVEDQIVITKMGLKGTSLLSVLS